MAAREPPPGTGVSAEKAPEVAPPTSRAASRRVPLMLGAVSVLAALAVAGVAWNKGWGTSSECEDGRCPDYPGMPAAPGDAFAIASAERGPKVARHGTGGVEAPTIGTAEAVQRAGRDSPESINARSDQASSSAADAGAGERRIEELCNPVLSNGTQLPPDKRCILYTLLGMGDAEMSPVATCAFESAAVRHPNRPVVVVIYGWAVPHKGRHEVLAKLPNLHIVVTTFRDSFAGVPALDEWYVSQAPRTVTDLLGGVRLALVYKYGGAFLDADMITRASLDGFRSTVGAQTASFGRNGSPYRFHGGEINNAVLVFEPRAEFMALACELFVKHYESGVFGVQGPVLIGRVANALRDKYNNNVPAEVMTIAEADAFNPIRAEKKIPGAKPRDQLMLVIQSAEEFQRYLPYTFRPVPTAFHLYSATLPQEEFSVKTVLGFAFHEGCPATYSACVARAPRPDTMCNLKSQFYSHTERDNSSRTSELMAEITRPGGERAGR